MEGRPPLNPFIKRKILRSVPAQQTGPTLEAVSKEGGDAHVY